MLKKLLRSLIFDCRCPLCNAEVNTEEYLCKKCMQKLKEMSFVKQRDGIYFFYYYQDIKKVILDFKFRNRKNLSKELKKFIEKGIKEIIEKEKIDFVIPIPISDKRKIERGFNQVEEILKSCEIKYEIVIRKKDTRFMYGLHDKESREKNISEAFYIPMDIKNKKILLVDDIITTGSTMKEMKKTLIESGSGEVIFFSLAVVKSYFSKKGNGD